VIGDYGSVSQIRNLRVVNANKRVYDVLGTFPNLKRLDINLGGLGYCYDLKELLKIRKGALLMDCGYNADLEPRCTLFDILSSSLYGFTELILNCMSSESPHLFLHFHLSGAGAAGEAVGRPRPPHQKKLTDMLWRCEIDFPKRQLTEWVKGHPDTRLPAVFTASEWRAEGQAWLESRGRWSDESTDTEP
jgi:hypothetical protein